LTNKTPKIPVKNNTKEILTTTEKYEEISLRLLNFSSGIWFIRLVYLSKIKKPSIKWTFSAGNFFPFLNKRIFEHSKNKP
tara:strand:+ start:33 stop:272 length:240 start_codon:yes stop_codon:yes gene_type:complete